MKKYEIVNRSMSKLLSIYGISGHSRFRCKEENWWFLSEKSNKCGEQKIEKANEDVSQ